MKFTDILKKLEGHEDLNEKEIFFAFDQIFSKEQNVDSTVCFLALLRDKGESVQEIVAALHYLEGKSKPVSSKVKDIIDTCGTGGDEKNTFNISTAASFIVAGAGVVVAKHGNRSVSSKCGSADVLEALGVKIDLPPEKVGRLIDTVGIGFLFAPSFHSSLTHVREARKALKTKSIFNILGPLLNPVKTKKQVIGVYSEHLLPLLVQVAKQMEMECVALVHGGDGMDEITLTTTTKIQWLKDGNISEEIFDPKSVGYSYCKPEDLLGGDAKQNALRLKQVLKGHSMPLDHCVHLNAALALLVSKRCTHFKEALLLVQESVSSGKAFEKLEQLIEFSWK
ncbi:MAG: anthranilate phosphoribosyltransferase [Deltaproteobacteria bacterium RIFCSPLOWO2_12_FULL_40_28]|nr:MAG: anthranilate phosphoribosyltransferase [Deltaproteobacteria bacterium RIFCSPHIGHO2_02_FULL_40_28]OGQ19660.1 MAG: anthranilate phosphoribosyltransferase [Deltaproteobacteria bacterium RIFCSPHIGHO2_12_FULL_40_32]OGQ40937.1 MAG: anthranilate phosphoribosyltransferase [Deltaproteobacteria bacterium RIFCSPLOWO2_02_FULL_40_36]OGQ54052.1 MAG: anthranilate phosphoribosyltransferase [Deltaproteobacteria bacterium RIFCSPLOWO2_12_FULL_40_28]